jgi:hypothetical protein
MELDLEIKLAELLQQTKPSSVIKYKWEIYVVNRLSNQKHIMCAFDIQYQFFLQFFFRATASYCIYVISSNVLYIYFHYLDFQQYRILNRTESGYGFILGFFF